MVSYCRHFSRRLAEDVLLIDALALAMVMLPDVRSACMNARAAVEWAPERQKSLFHNPGAAFQALLFGHHIDKPQTLASMDQQGPGSG